MANTAQRSMSAGELSPAMYARTDLQRYATGLRTLRNAYVLRTGGVQSRAGFEYLGSTKNNGVARLIEAVFDDDANYVLEFGNLYIRFWRDGALVDVGTPAAWVTATAYTVGVVREEGGTNYVCLVAHMSGTFATDLTAGKWYALTGTIYEWPTDYVTADLFDLQVAYQLDVVTIVHPTYPPATLTRTSDAVWALAEIDFGVPGGIAAPTGLSATISQTGLYAWEAEAAWSTPVAYVVGDLAEQGGVTYVCRLAHTSALDNRPGLSTGWPAFWTTKGPDWYAVNDLVISGGDVYRCYVAHSADSTNEPGVGVDWEDFWAIKGEDGDDAGFWYVVTAVDDEGRESNASTAVKTDSSQNSLSPTWRNVSLSWSPVASAAEYRVYRSQNSALTYRQIGSAGGLGFSDTNPFDSAYISDAGPSVSADVFNSANNYPAVVAAYQQRLLLAGTNAEPDVVRGSVVAEPYDFTVRFPLLDSDAVNWRQVGRRLNRVRHFAEVAQRLIQFSSVGESIVQGDTDGILRPGEVNPRQFSENGAAVSPSPLVINDSALYVQARGGVVRDIAPIEASGFAGSDLTLMSAHLVDGFTLVDWTYQQTPNSAVWAVRDDGTLLSLTYVRELGILGWATHDTDGVVESVCCVPESNRDAVYAVIRRTIDGNTVRYVERMSDRLAATPVIMDSYVTVT